MASDPGLTMPAMSCAVGEPPPPGVTVVLELGPTASQFVGVDAAVAVNVVGVEVVRFNVWLCGTWPLTKEKIRLPGLKLTPPVPPPPPPPTVITTDAVAVPTPVDTVTVPVYVPVGSDPGFTFTLNCVVDAFVELRQHRDRLPLLHAAELQLLLAEIDECG